MLNLKEIINTKFTGQIPSWLIWSIVILALIGFTDAAFLLAKRLSGTPIPCFITHGCDEVSKSPYSVMFGVPLSAWGVLFYLGTGFLAILFADTKNLFVGKLVPVATTLGFLSSCYFIYVQKFLIGAFCIYCIMSALIATILFMLGIIFWRKLKG
jgi:uncharacterized membrane protein